MSAFARGWTIAVPTLFVLASSCGNDDRPGYIDTERRPPTSSGGASGGGTKAGDAGAGEIQPDGGETNAGGASGAPGGVGTAPCAATLPTGFCVVSDLVNPKLHESFSVSDPSKLTLHSTFASSVTGSASTEERSMAWTFEFGPPALEFFVPGSYVQDHNDDDSANFSVFGDTSCDHTGDFQVSEIEWDAWGEIIRFAATFTQTCDGYPDVHRGAINFNAHGEPDVPPEDPSDCQVETPIGFCFVSQGENRTFREDHGPVTLGADDAKIVPWSVLGGLQLEIQSPDTTVGYIVKLFGPDKEPLAPGHYTNTAAYEMPGQPTLGGPCNGMVGEFDILALETAAAGGASSGAEDDVLHADIDFHYHCGGGASEAEAYAKFRYQRP
jgi:hypothetical protein